MSRSFRTPDRVKRFERDPIQQGVGPVELHHVYPAGDSTGGRMNAQEIWIGGTFLSRTLFLSFEKALKSSLRGVPDLSGTTKQSQDMLVAGSVLAPESFYERNILQ